MEVWRYEGSQLQPAYFIWKLFLCQRNYSIFTKLKHLFYILIFAIGINFTSEAQSKSTDPLGSIQPKLLKFYPNPATSAINFDFSRGYDRSYSLQIFNFMGKKIYHLKNPSPTNYIGLEEFYRGIYIFQLRDKNGSIVESGKFQVIR